MYIYVSIFRFGICKHHIAYSAQTEHCSTFHFPYVCMHVRHSRDIATLLNNLMIETIYELHIF